MGIRLKLIIFITLLFIVAIGNTFFSYKLENNSERKIEWIDHTHHVLIEAERLLSSIQGAETGQRGFLLTKDIDYLEPYSQGLIFSEKHYIHLVELVSDHPEQLKRLRRIKILMRLKFNELTETITLVKDGNSYKALKIVKRNYGKQYMDKMRTIIKKFISVEEFLLEKRENNLRENRATITTVISVEIVLLIFFALLSVLFLRKTNELIQDKDKLKLMVEEETEKNRQKDHIILEQSKHAQMGEMIGNIAHQWRQPLNALALIIQKIGIYKERDLLDDEKIEESIQKSLQLVNGMSETIDDFRDFFSPHKESTLFSVCDAISRAHTILTPVLVTHSIEYKLISQEDITIKGYRNEFSQAILNLLNNAKDALLDNQINMPRITITIEKNMKHVVVSICDNAGGVPEALLNKVFNPYFTTKEEGKGTGIGLFVSKAIIEEHMNGSLSVYNAEEGACFVIKCDLA